LPTSTNGRPKFIAFLRTHWPWIKRGGIFIGSLALVCFAYHSLNACLADDPACCIVIARILYLFVPIAIVGMLIYIRSPIFRTEYHRLPPYGMAYHAYLVAHYREVMGRPTPPPVEEPIRKIVVEDDPTELWWKDLFNLELWVQNNLTLEELKRKAWLLRRRYAIVSGKKTLQAYLDSGPPDIAANTDEKALRADLAQLLQDLYWIYEVRTAWGKGRDSISRYIGWFLMVTTLSLGTIAVARAWQCNPPGGPGLLLIYETVMVGATGGLVSLWRRLQVTPAVDRRLDGILEFEYGRMTIMFQSFISGAIFAFVLMLIFAAGLAEGTLFPSFKVEGDQTTFLDVLTCTAGKSEQVAKLLVWSFIAGFAERFVPDFLDRLTKSANQSSEGEPAESQQASA